MLSVKLMAISEFKTEYIRRKGTGNTVHSCECVCVSVYEDRVSVLTLFEGPSFAVA